MDNQTTKSPYPLADAYFGTMLARFGSWIGLKVPRLMFLSHGINLMRTWWWTKDMTPVRRQMFFNQLMAECSASIEEQQRKEWEHEEGKREFGEHADAQ